MKGEVCLQGGSETNNGVRIGDGDNDEKQDYNRGTVQVGRFGEKSREARTCTEES